MVCCGEGEVEVKLRKELRPNVVKNKLIEGLQTLLTGTWGPPATFLIQGICRKVTFLVSSQGLCWVFLGLAPRLCLSSHSTTDKLLITTK